VNALWSQSCLMLRLSQKEEMTEVLKTLVEACNDMTSLHGIVSRFTRLPIEPAVWLKRAERHADEYGVGTGRRASSQGGISARKPTA
jgi:hypothetical protein